MASNQLSAMASSGTQSATQSPQASVGSGTTTAAASSVQPGTATSILNGNGSVLLRSTSLTTLKLGGTAQSNTTTASGSNSQPTPHHVNAGLFGVSLVLLVVAAFLFWYTGKTAKNTTY